MKWSRYLRKYFWLPGERLQKARSWLVPRLLLTLNTVLMRSLRITISGRERMAPYLDEPCATGALFVTWHDLSLALVHMFRHKNIGVLMSRSRWGQLQAAFWRLSGFPTVWGSSKKREAVQALRESIRLLRTGQSFAFTPDGPKGPRHEAQPGVVFMATHTPTVIIPMGIAASSAWRLPTWDRYMIPKPFARVHVHVGEALNVPPDLSRAEMEDWRVTVEQALKAAEAAAIEEIKKKVKGRVHDNPGSTTAPR